MPHLPDSVRPGDLVTAVLVNDILLELQRLDARLAELEAAQFGQGAVVILRTLPAGVVRMGERLTVIGRNFGVPDENVVHIGGVRVTQFAPGSDDAVLLFNVPPIVGIGSGGQVVTLTLSNPRGFASTEVSVEPGGTDTLVAAFDIRFEGPAVPGPIEPGSSRVFLFSIDPRSNRAARYGLTASNDQGWSTVVVDEAGNPVSPPEVEIPQSNAANATRLTFGAQVTIPSTAAQNTDFQISISIQAIENPLQGGTRTVGLTVGQAPAPPSTAIVVTTMFVIPPAQLQGGVIAVPAGVTGVVRVQAAVEESGTYRAEEPTLENGAGWEAALAMADPTFPLTSGGNRDIDLTLSPSASAGDATLRVRVVRDDDSTVFGELIQPIRLL